MSIADEYENEIKKQDKARREREKQREIEFIQDTTLIIAHLLLPFTEKGRTSVTQKAIEIAKSLTPPIKIKQ